MSKMIQMFSGVILAGGKSNRMGKDKALIDVCGKTFIEIITEELSSLFADLIVVTSNPQLLGGGNYRTCSDIFRDSGPLGGIHAGLSVSKSRYSLVVPCDMPFLNKALIEHMLHRADGCDVVVAEWNGKLQVFPAVYSRNCIRPIERQLRSNKRRVTDLLEDLNKAVLHEDEIVEFDPGKLTFVNINTPLEWQRIQRELCQQ